MNAQVNYDVLVIGSGAAGLTLALHLAARYRVALISKQRLQDGSTWFAQGGIAAVLDKTDSVQSHIADTLDAGAGLCHPSSVHFTVEGGTAAIRWLIDQGVDFTREGSDYHLTKEGGHSYRRIIHSTDATGRAVHSTLIDRVRGSDNIDCFEQHLAVDLIRQPDPQEGRFRCGGAYVLDRSSGEVVLFQARAVVLATGGASKAYLYTSNPDGASGDGIAMAWRAGCRVANMEFNQFHPTCLYHPKAKALLVTEALRGEGAYLKLPDGSRFMDRFDRRGELAPRDIVARAIDHEMKRLGADCLYLDISHREADFVREHFPTVYSNCLQYGIDITCEPIPVVPAAHYTCGGIMVDRYGRTDLDQLYAIGETTFTGLHGANRLASNSLLECLVYARSAARHIDAHLEVVQSPRPAPPWDASRVTDSDEDVVISHNWDELRRFMWDYVGIVRTRKRLLRAQHRVKLLQREIREFYANYRITNDLVELRNLALVSELIIRSALERRESRGLHYSLDYPKLRELAMDTILVPENFANQRQFI
ncbi:L-aspartate oxidase [Microbulbifer spongiae]|uniref:L-aspartate oxidase n=1 Tax=Microbulbifer spongiae TaxID=2944933 RepID=A0ABY9EF78_9GAMM|nr:L-aspartate oxidase [Microbulbifer sp. MI-G]WKD50897.1 L-aspartate oxidase [Microbulbifer sp. MI-G]